MPRSTYAKHPDKPQQIERGIDWKTSGDDSPTAFLWGEHSVIAPEEFCDSQGRRSRGQA